MTFSRPAVRRALGLGLALAVAGVVMAGCAPRKSKAPQDHGPPEVGVVTLAARPVTLTAELPGRT
ncbi:MAG: efflux transporter periplasmic adaptor subunit, partial [Caulobacteraceae bacterium]